MTNIIMHHGAMGADEYDNYLDAMIRKIALACPNQENDWVEKYGANYENKVFVMRSYYWGDCDCDEEGEEHIDGCLVMLPNFLHKPSGLAVKWYKYIGRGMEVNNYVSEEELEKIKLECIQSTK